MRLIISTILLLACIAARASEIDDTPKMQFIMELSVNIGSPLQVGDTGKGNRTIIPITGGTFSGPQIKGTVIRAVPTISFTTIPISAIIWKPYTAYRRMTENTFLSETSA